MDQIQFLPSNLTAPAPGRTYQIWLVGPAGPRSVGTFNPEPGRSSPRLFPGPGQATELVVTEEPAGGSTRPTTQPILSMMLPT
jgi:anti-sigma-K factor RskA